MDNRVTRANDATSKAFDELLKINAGRMRSIVSIVAALFELMRDKPYADITVSDICAAAGVSRKTFYRSFESKVSVVKMHVDMVYLDCSKKNGFARSGARSIYMYFYEHILKEPAFSKLFVEPDLFDIMTDKIKEYVEIELEDTWYNSVAFEPMLAEYYLKFAAVGISSLMRIWVQNNCKTPAKTMAILTERLLSGVL